MSGLEVPPYRYISLSTQHDSMLYLSAFLKVTDEPQALNLKWPHRSHLHTINIKKSVISNGTKDRTDSQSEEAERLWRFFLPDNTLPLHCIWTDEFVWN